jgi:hypothetical protein
MNKQTQTIVLLLAAAAVVYFIMSKPTVAPVTTLPVYRPGTIPAGTNPVAADVTAGGAAASSIINAINTLNSDD